MPRAIQALRRWHDSLQRVQATKLILLPSLTGALTGAAAIAFVELLNLVHWLALGSTGPPLQLLSNLPWYHVLLVPAAGGLIVGPLVHWLAPEAEGHGVPEVIEAVSLGGGRIRRRVAAVKTVASAVTIGTGGSVGREGPIVQIGAAVGSALGQLLRLPAEQLRTLAACGAAGGIAAVFNAPIAGAFFALEVIAGNFAMPAFGPVILSSVVATVISRAYFGNHPAFVVQPFVLESNAEIGLYVGLGILCGGVSALFVTVMDRAETLATRLPLPKPWRPLTGGLLLGLLFLVVPNLYGVGYETMDATLRGELSWPLLALLVPLKILATSLTLASGGSGGVFLPALYVGAAAGGLYGNAVHAVLPNSTAGSGAYALIGMAGVLSASTHSPITSLLLLLELTHDYRTILPVMVVVTLATFVARAIKRDSLYTLKLSRRGIALHRREDLIMRSHTVGEIMHEPAHAISDRTSIAETLQYFLDHDVVHAYVCDARARFIGSISIHDIKDPEVRELGSLVVAGDLAASNPHAVQPTATLAECLDHFVLSTHDEVPVVDDRGKLVGIVSHRDVLRIYSSELLRHEYVGLAFREGERSEQVRLGTGLTLARLPTPPWLVGRSLRAAQLRNVYNLTAVAVRPADGGDEQLPDPDAPLGAQEVLVVVGKPEDIERFRHATGATPVS
jgi:CIC family chloride channel protein